MMADSLPTGPPDPEHMRTREKALRDVYVRDTDTMYQCVLLRVTLLYYMQHVIFISYYIQCTF